MATTGTITVLGCGGSGGVPLATGFWGACDPANPKNRRMRASIAVRTQNACVVIDTGPDFHAQTLAYGIKNITGIAYTHAHSDHVNGVDELRYIKYVQKHDIDIWGDLDTLSDLQSRFSHLFVASVDGLYDPVLTPHVLTADAFGKPLDIGGITMVPYWQKHGTAGRSVGYRIGDFAYSTDVSGLDDAAFAALAGVETWLLDCAQFASDFTVAHANFDMVRAWNDRVGAKRVILTHLTPRLDYSGVSAQLPAGYELAYDGLELAFISK